MSWKSLVTAGLLCVLASPALAAPAVTSVKGGTFATSYLNAAGDWVTNIQISNTSPVPTGSSPLAAELGFTASGGALAGASNLSTGANDDFDTVNPGTSIFGWENPGTGTNGKPEGVQSNCAVGCTESTPGTAPNTVFAALGSVDFGTVGPHDFIQIITKGPSTGAGRSLTSTLTVSGAYAGKGRIAEAQVGTPPSVNFDTYNNVFAKTAKAGDANLDGNVDGLDLGILATNFGASSGLTWYKADYNTDNASDGLDLGILAGNFGASGPPPGAGGGLGAGAAVPEPSTVALVGLALLGGLGIIRRKR